MGFLKGTTAHIRVVVTVGWKAGKAAKCELQWWEWTNEPYFGTGESGRQPVIKKEKWADLSKGPITENFKGWDKAMTDGLTECPPEKVIIINDRPSFGGEGGAHRVLFGVVKVFSGCPSHEGGMRKSRVWTQEVTVSHDVNQPSSQRTWPPPPPEDRPPDTPGSTYGIPENIDDYPPEGPPPNPEPSQNDPNTYSGPGTEVSPEQLAQRILPKK